MSIIEELRHLFREYVKRKCEPGQEKTELLDATSSTLELMNKWEKGGNLTEIPKEKAAQIAKFWARLKEESACIVWGQERDEQIISEIEFWCKQLDTVSSWTIPNMFFDAEIPDIKKHVEDTRLNDTNLNGEIVVALAEGIISASEGSRDPTVQLDIRQIRFPGEGFNPIKERYNRPRRSDLGGIELRKWADFKGDAGEWSRVIVEFKAQPSVDADEANVYAAQTDLSKLVRVLRLASQRKEAFHILHCYGWYQSFNHFGLVYQVPGQSDRTQCLSLSNILLNNSHKTLLARNLENRFNLAKTLASTLFRFHSANWVHRSFSPDNILLFGERAGSGFIAFDWSHPYVVGFASSRYENAHSEEVSSKTRAIQPYVHPDRQGDDYIRFRKSHDIYSLGVVLLEIGRLDSFLGERWVNEWKDVKPHKVRDVLVRKVLDLKGALGPRFAEATLSCLTFPFGINPENKNLEEENNLLLEDFRLNVYEKLQQITI